jgi:hypothetical protein
MRRRPALEWTLLSIVAGSLVFAAPPGLGATAADTGGEGTRLDLAAAVSSGDASSVLRALTVRQLDHEPRAPPAAPETDLLTAASQLLDRTATTRPDALASLSELEPSVQAGLARVFSAFLAFDAATRAYLDGAGVDAVFAARLQLLDATLAFGRSTAATPVPLVLDAAPAFTLDLQGIDSTYVSDAALSLDVEGNDVYLNRAGGGGAYVNTNCPVLEMQLPRQAGRLLPAGFLADFAGDDRYVSGYDCGTNGGGLQGAGFLYDAGGNDHYSAGQGGVNGGAYLGGVGYLQDEGEGDDVYEARPEHSVYGYGANGAGSLGGYGALADDGGNDQYLAGQEGANGGGYALGVGSLVDAWGDDLYRAGALGTNGAAYLGNGLLWDRAGNDSYLITQDFGNTNGDLATLLNMDQPMFSACLYDGNGHDWYDDFTGNPGWDLTVHPKGSGGSQYDDVGAAAGDCPG